MSSLPVFKCAHSLPVVTIFTLTECEHSEKLQSRFYQVFFIGQYQKINKLVTYANE